MECKMVRALDMAALSAKCSALSMVYNGDILHSLCARACTYCGSMYLGSYHFLPGGGASICDGRSSIFSGPPPLHA